MVQHPCEAFRFSNTNALFKPTGKLYAASNMCNAVLSIVRNLGIPEELTALGDEEAGEQH
jgi:hypothetical protein